MRISTYTFSARSFMATKITSVCDGRLQFDHYYHLPFWFLHVRLLSFVLLFHKRDILSLPVCEGFSMTMAQGLIAISFICNSVVPSDDWTPMGLSLHSLIILTGGVSIDPGLEESYIFLWGLGCVFPRFLVTTRVTHTEHFHIHTHNKCRLSHHHTKLRDHSGFFLACPRRVFPHDLRPGSPRRGHVPPLWVWVFHAVRGMQRNTSTTSSSSVPVGALRHLRTLNTTRPLRSDRRNSPGPGRYKSTGHGTVGGNSGCDERLHFTISATWPDDVTCDILFLVCATGKRFCLDAPVNPCLIHLAQGPRGFRLKLW